MRLLLSALAVIHACCFHSDELIGFRFCTRVLQVFLCATALHSHPGVSCTIRTWRRRTSHFVGKTLVQIADMMSTPCSTYVVVLPALQRRQWTKTGSLLDAKKFYVGSTTKTVHQRHDARIRKLRLLQQGQFTNTEIMVHYFHNHADLFDTVILPLGTFPDKVSVRAAECTLIHSWKPGLNMPWLLISTQPLQPVRRSRPCPIVNTVVLENAYGGRHADDFAHWVFLRPAASAAAVFLKKN